MSQQWKVLLAFTGIFVAGAVAGGVVMLRVGVEKARAEQRAQVPAKVSEPAVVSPRLMQSLRQLKLTPEQTEKVQPLINEASDKIAAISRQNMAATNDLLEALDAKISPMLTDEQRKQLDERKMRRDDQVNNRVNASSRGRGGPGSQLRGGPGERPGQFPGGGSSPSGPARGGGSRSSAPSPEVAPTR